MKRIDFILPAVLLAVGCAQPKTNFVLHGYVPGTMDSTEVNLRSEDRSLDLTGYTVNGEFTLTGEAPEGRYCDLSMNNYNAAERHGIREEGAVKYVTAHFFVENGDMEFRTPHIDSLPQSFWRYDVRRENNYTLTGSKSHEVFDRYRRQTLDLQAAIHDEERKALEGSRTDGARLVAMQEELREKTRAFIASQRNLAVNLHLAEMLKPEPFTCTREELDATAALFAGYADTTASLQAFRDFYREAAAYVQGTPFAGGQVVTPQGDTLDLKQCARPDRYMLIDFWASWCGPCRASFPHLRKTYETHGKDMVFLSVSVDQKEADWRQAMEEEQLPWTQLRATPALSRMMGKTYKINSIPTFLLVDPAGRILFSGHDSNELDAQLKKL